MNNYDISPRQFLREEKITSIFANLLDKALKGSLKRLHSRKESLLKKKLFLVMKLKKNFTSENLKGQ